MGDDLVFWTHLGLTDYTYPNRSTLSFIAAHILGCNGRVFDYMGPVVINLMPRTIAAIIMGCMAGLFFYSILFVSNLPRRGYISLSILLIGTSLAITPWWDSMFMRVCQFNYLWGTTFCLLTTGLFIKYQQITSKKNKILRIGLFTLGVMAGCAHEQTGVAMCGAFFLYLIYHKRYRLLSLQQKSLSYGLIFGTFLTVGAPSIWLRAASDSLRQDFSLLLITTLPSLLFLVILIFCLSMFKQSRQFLKNVFADGSVQILFLASIFAGIIAIYSGIPGRTGLFSEICALVILTKMIITSGLKTNKVFGYIISILCYLFIILHLAISIHEQHELYDEYKDVRAAYSESEDGIVFYDFTSRYNGSPLTLRRVKGVPDADDTWLLHALQIAYKPDGQEPTILPTAFSDLLPDITETTRLGNVTVYVDFPDDVYLTRDSVMIQQPTPDNTFIVRHVRMANKRDIWVSTERIRDPGDYEFEIIQKL